MVREDVAHVESLPFSAGVSRSETYCSSAEPLREWEIVVSAGKDDLTMAEVTLEEWRSGGDKLLEP